MTDRRLEPRPKGSTHGTSAETSPARQVRLQLAAAKAAGTPFDRAWPAALSRVKYPPEHVERQAWLYGLRSTRSHWEAAYQDIEDALGQALTRAA